MSPKIEGITNDPVSLARVITSSPLPSRNSINSPPQFHRNKPRKRCNPSSIEKQPLKKTTLWRKTESDNENSKKEEEDEEKKNKHVSLLTGRQSSPEEKRSGVLKLVVSFPKTSPRKTLASREKPYR